MRDDKVRRQLENRIKKINAQLARTQDPDEEERLLNELLYLQGAIAGLNAKEGRGGHRLAKKRGRK